MQHSIALTVLLITTCCLTTACQDAAPESQLANLSTLESPCDADSVTAGGCKLSDCLATGCGSPVKDFDNIERQPTYKEQLEQTLRSAIVAQSGGVGLQAFTLPESDDYNAIPQDPNNSITAAKVELGKMLFHDNRFALNGFSDQSPSWSCSTCHTVANGFKPGISQGIGEGGQGIGEQRRLAFGFDPNAPEESANKPDMQPIAVPSILNVAFQEVVLWNGQLGNASNGLINSSLSSDILAPANLPSNVNVNQLAGIESQAIAGQIVHRLRFTHDSPLQQSVVYQNLWNNAYPAGSIDIAVDVAKAIASFERTVFANQAPFQRWLRGEENALNESELAGANLFFGKAGCSSCHTGPALSSRTGALEDEVFFSLGFADFDNNKVAIHGPIAEEARLGRGGFTNDPTRYYQFKVPQLYNLADSSVFGHGASFKSIKQVIEYKNNAVAQNADAINHLDRRFRPLNMSIREVNELTTFLTTALYDPSLDRYFPVRLPD